MNITEEKSTTLELICQTVYNYSNPRSKGHALFLVVGKKSILMYKVVRIFSSWLQLTQCITSWKNWKFQNLFDYIVFDDYKLTDLEFAVVVIKNDIRFAILLENFYSESFYKSLLCRVFVEHKEYTAANPAT